MQSSKPTQQFAGKTALVTGANSGLGFEAAAQLAEAGYSRVILACRTLEKAETAKQALAARVGSDPFEALAVDVSSIESAQAASDELVRRGDPIDALLLNAGMVSGDEMNKSIDGLELSFASSIVGHHVMTSRLLDAGLLPEGARVVIAGSEAARNDAPAMMGMKLYDFATGVPVEFGDNFHDAMVSFATGAKPELFDSSRYYATTKAFTSWWTAAMARKNGETISVFTVSPGTNMATKAARHTTGFKNLMFTKIMPAIGPALGMDQPVPLGAKRYVDVLNSPNGEYVNGKSYMSKPKKLTGPMEETNNAHLFGCRAPGGSLACSRRTHGYRRQSRCAGRCPPPHDVIGRIKRMRHSSSLDPRASSFSRLSNSMNEKTVWQSSQAVFSAQCPKGDSFRTLQFHKSKSNWMNYQLLFLF